MLCLQEVPSSAAKLECRGGPETRAALAGHPDLLLFVPRSERQNKKMEHTHPCSRKTPWSSNRHGVGSASRRRKLQMGTVLPWRFVHPPKVHLSLGLDTWSYRQIMRNRSRGVVISFSYMRRTPWDGQMDGSTCRVRKTAIRMIASSPISGSIRRDRRSVLSRTGTTPCFRP